MRRAAPFLTFAAALALLAVAMLAHHPASTLPSPPFHAVVVPPDDPRILAARADVDRLLTLRRERAIPIGGVGDREYQSVLGRLQSAPAALLSYLEESALRVGSVPVRVELLNAVAGHPGGETRRFLSLLVLDSSADPTVRIAALEPLMSYRDAETFEVLQALWRDPAPFAGRYHVCRALGESGRTEAVPLLREALWVSQPFDVRCHAALGLGGFADDPAVRDGLRSLVRTDPLPAVRGNALQALSRSSAPDVDAFLREVGESPATDAETRKAAQAFLSRRGK